MAAVLTLTYGALNLTASPYLVQFGLDVGAPANDVLALPFLLQDGEIELSSRSGNRTLQFVVLIEGANLSALAAAEAALVAETEKPLNTLTVDPGDSAPASVYETYRAQVTLLRDDNYERAGLRAYQIVVRAQPFARSEDEVVVPALPASGGSGSTTVDSGSSATGWTGTINGVSNTPTVVSGAVGLDTGAVAGTTTISLTRTGSITTSAKKFLTVVWKGSTDRDSLLAFGDGTALQLVTQTYLGGTSTQATYYVTASSIAALRFDAIRTSSSLAHRTLYIDNISISDIRPAIGTSRQQLRTVDMAGSAPAPGTLSVQHATNALGDALVYTWPVVDGHDVYLPALSQYENSGSRTSDAALVSGGYNTNIAQFDVPQVMLPPGPYLAVGRVRAASGTVSTSLSFDVRTRVNSTQIDATYASPGVSASLTTTPMIVVLGKINLPLTDVGDGSAATVRFGVFQTSYVADIRWDEVWLFNTEIGQLVQVDCGTGAAASGGPSKALFINAPTVDTPRPTVLRGHASDQSDAFHAGVLAWQFPRFVPPRVNVFTVTTNTLDADVSFQFYPHWHTNAAS